MNDTVLAAIDAEIAGLERVVPVPTGELGYGTDLSCTTELDPMLAEVDPQSRQAVGEACIRRLITARGSLPDDADYGLDIRSYANRGVPESEYQAIAGLISLELTKDDRVVEAVAVVTQPERNALDIKVTITLADPNLAPFALTLAVVDGETLSEVLL